MVFINGVHFQPITLFTNQSNSNYISKSNMFENMYMCTADAFHKFKLGNTTDRTRLVMNCDNPVDTRQLKYMHFSFGLFKKSASDFVFNPNETYYFIATSNGTEESLSIREGGDVTLII